MTLTESYIADIQNGIRFSDAHLADALISGSRMERFTTCKKLAMALASEGEFRQSRLLAQRALILWNGEPDFIDEYLNLLRADQNAEGIRKVSKHAGMWMANHGSLSHAINYFNIHQYAYQSTGAGDHYEYDGDILKTIEQLAPLNLVQGRYRQMYEYLPSWLHQPIREMGRNRPIRVAYLVHGAGHSNSALVRALTNFAHFHDRALIECLFFSPEIDSPNRHTNIELIRCAGAQLVTVDSSNVEFCLMKTSKNLQDYQPDIVVTVGALADYRQYYLYCCCSSVLRVVLGYGPPAQFVPPSADFNITASRHVLLDSPCDGEIVDIEMMFSEHPITSKTLPTGLVVPDDSVVLIAAGRSEKFLDREYWETIFEVLVIRQEIQFIVIGLESRPPFLDELMTGDLKRRVHILGWLDNYQSILALADIVIDTYPSGGGITCLESMAFGIPVIMFKNDYLQPFDQRTWSLAEEILENEELVISRGDFQNFKRLLIDLIDSSSLRKRLGLECKAHIAKTRGNPERMIRHIEKIYFQLLQKRAKT